MNTENKFVNLHRPKDIRVTNLETVKEIIKSIEQHYKLKILRKSKLLKYAKLKKNTKELNLLFSKLYEYFPEHSLIQSVKKEPTKRKSKKKSKSEKTKIDPTEAELNKLEKTLSLIENKLKKI